MKRLIQNGSIGAVLVLVACGGDGDGGSGVAGSKKLEELSAAEVQKICEWQRDSYKDSLGTEEEFCRSFAVGASSEESCESMTDECIASSDYEDELADDWECEEETTEGLEDCAATVAQYQDCIAAIDKKEAELFNDLTCADESPEGGDYEVPEECDQVIELCPEVLDGIID